MNLVVGLGNPEKEYTFNRHNAGFLLVDDFAKKLDLTFDKSTKLNSLIATNAQVIIAKPQTFMNNSGDAVSKLSSFYKVPLSNLFIVHDDLDLDFGVVKKQFGSGAAGHHGVEDVIEKLGSKEFWRIRVGTGKPSNKGETKDFVLNDFTQSELEFLKSLDLSTYL